MKAINKKQGINKTAENLMAWANPKAIEAEIRFDLSGACRYFIKK